MSDLRVAAPPLISSTFAVLVSGREDEFPILARAAQNTVPALNPKVVWDVENDTGEHWDWNYCQIFRSPFVVAKRSESAFLVARRRAADSLLAQIEQQFTHGNRTIEMTNQRCCGGYRDLLSRDLRDDDVLTLRVLREPCLRDRRADPTDVDYEWTGEATLQALAADQIPAREEAIA